MGIPGSANPMLFGGAAAYQINQSLRFDGSSHLSLAATGSGGSSNFTLSVWVKLTKNTGANGCIFGGSGYAANAQGLFLGDGNSKLTVAYNWGIDGTGQISNALFRDPSAWYHLVMKVAGTNLDLYINNEEVSLSQDQSYSTNNFNSSSVARLIGAVATNSPSDKLNGYLAEFHFVDGSSLTPSSFGETDTITGAWIPKKYSGSHGTNGFYLKFDPAATNGIGHDHSGNGNNFTATGFSTSGTGTDVMSDTPTNNFATYNPLVKFGSQGSFSDGNLASTAAAQNSYASIPFFASTTGKYYVEFTANSGSHIAVDGRPVDTYNSGRYIEYQPNGNIVNGGGASGASFTTNDIIGVAIDMDNLTVAFYKNNSLQATVNLSNGSLPGAGFCVGNYSSVSAIHYVNFGQRAFAYTPPTGFKALNTANLPEPTIKKGSKYFDTKLYTGNSTGGAATQTLTGFGFSPDFVWIKGRASSTANHSLFDQVRGTGKVLWSQSTNQEETNYSRGYLSAFTSDGFTVTTGSTDGRDVNGLSTGSPPDTYVAWAWDANGAGSSNTAGTITSTVSANASAGFSIVTYTGNGNNGATIGHGLGVEPAMIILKERTSSPHSGNWFVYHKNLPSQPANINLNNTSSSAPINATGQGGMAYAASNASSVFQIYTGASGVENANRSTATYVAYCFSEVAGYSKFGSYTGNGSSDGPFVACNFRPAWILLKSTSSGSWELYDTARDTYNQAEKTLEPNSSAVEGSGYPIDVLSNGFKVRTSNSQINYSSYSYIFAAFAEHPFKYANAR